MELTRLRGHSELGHEAQGRSALWGRPAKYAVEYLECAVAMVRETGKPIAEVARDLEINEGTLGDWRDERGAARHERTARGARPRWHASHRPSWGRRSARETGGKRLG